MQNRWRRYYYTDDIDAVFKFPGENRSREKERERDGSIRVILELYKIREYNTGEKREKRGSERKEKTQ